MAIDDLPPVVVNFLNLIGVDWPYIDEDAVWQFAGLVREFGAAVQRTHDDATTAVQGIAQAHKSLASQHMANGWAELSQRHVTEIVQACSVLAVALDSWGGYIVAQKAAAIVELEALAVAFVEDQAAAVETVGLAEAAVPVIIAAAKKVTKAVVETLVQYAVAEVIEKAAKPLFQKVKEATAGLDWEQAPAPPVGVAQGFELDLEQLATHTGLMRAHAATMRGHASKLRAGIEALSF